MSATIRPPTEDEREPLGHLFATALNFETDRAVARARTYPLDQMFVAEVDGAVVASAGDFRFRQWFGGRDLACSGIWGVATLPEHRETGLASACTRAVLEQARDRGDTITALYPAVLAPYRRLGYELAGTYASHRVPLDDLAKPSDDLPRVELLDVDRDLEGARACYRAWIASESGPVEPTTNQHWRDRLLTDPLDQTFCAVAVREAGEVTGFGTIVRKHDPALLEMEFGLEAGLWVAITDSARRALLGYARGFRGLGRWLEWPGPVNDPMAFAVPSQSVTTPFMFRWMLRLLDVRGTFEQRGWPSIDAEVVFGVRDELWPENDGPWHLSVRGGTATMSPASSAPVSEPMPIGIVSSIFSGYLRARDAARLGLLRPDDPAVDALERLLVGPPPWSPIFF